jgi:hypothetical protein
MAAHFPYPPHLIRINFYGAAPFFRPEVRAPILDVLESHPSWAPETVTMGDQEGDPYVRKEVLEQAKGVPTRTLRYIERATELAYSLRFANGEKPDLAVKLPIPQTEASSLPSVFALADALAAAYPFDMGWVHIVSTVPPRTKDPEQQTLMLMDFSYLKHEVGAAGCLGLRTYFGPYVLPMIQERLLLSLPAPCEVVKLPGGAIRVDLSSSPWSADVGTLCSSWRSAMNHLEEAEFFATLRIDDSGATHWTKRKNSDPGGKVRQ